MVMALIKKELEKYSADRLGKFDFALHSAGKIVVLIVMEDSCYLIAEILNLLLLNYI